MRQALTSRRTLAVLCALGVASVLAACSRAGGDDPTRGISATGEVTEPGAFGDYNALVIGIDEYQAWPDLRFAERDATRIADLLVEKYGFETRRVTRVIGEQATRRAVLKAVRTKLETLTERDNLLIYYAGHGQLDSLTNTGYWVPVDGDLDDSSSWIPFSTITELLAAAQVRAKNIVLLTDSCYGGAVLRAGPTPGLPTPDADHMQHYMTQLAQRAAKRSRQVLASGGYEQVPDESMFAALLTRALEENEFPAVSLERIFFTISPQIEMLGQQQPAFARVISGPDLDGQFVLLRAGASRGADDGETAAPAKLVVRTSTGDGRVLIDGTEKGQAPVDLELSAGKHTVAVEKQGHRRFEQDLVLAEGEQRTLTAELPRIAGPRIESFRIEPDEIASGDSVTLSWATADAADVTLSDLGAVGASGSRQVQPSKSRVYTLEATNSAGERVTAERSVTVRARLPVIEAFDAAPDAINAGESSELAWRVRGASSVTLLERGSSAEPKEVRPQQEMRVQPGTTTTYLLLAYNADRARVGKQVTVNVTEAPPRITAFHSNTARITSGGSATLSWNTERATSVELSGVGAVGASGNTQVSPAAATTYELLARNGGGTVRQQLTVEVAPRRGTDVVIRDHRVLVDPARFVLASNQCKQGYVWREAYQGDVVCVTPDVRTQAAADNRAAASRWISGAYGPHTCIGGYVWREARTGDDVCVTPQIRTQTRNDNAAAASRRAGG
jgi:hypothetical protein